MVKFEYKENCCSFCDPQNANKFSWIGVDDVRGYDSDEGYYIDDEGYLGAIADDQYCGTGPLKINFCPMCGRSLKVVYKVNDLEKDFENNDKEN